MKIGEGFSCIDAALLGHDEPNLSLIIGNGCMFSEHIVFRLSDGHTIYDKDTGRVLNVPKSGINIGNHVWIGMYVKILKDVSIADNSIVGAGAIVTKSFTDKNVIIAGTPAKIIKTNINWNHQNTEQYLKNNNLAGV